MLQAIFPVESLDEEEWFDIHCTRAATMPPPAWPGAMALRELLGMAAAPADGATESCGVGSGTDAAEAVMETAVDEEAAQAAAAAEEEERVEEETEAEQAEQVEAAEEEERVEEETEVEQAEQAEADSDDELELLGAEIDQQQAAINPPAGAKKRFTFTFLVCSTGSEAHGRFSSSRKPGG